MTTVSFLSRYLPNALSNTQDIPGTVKVSVANEGRTYTFSVDDNGQILDADAAKFFASTLNTFSAHKRALHVDKDEVRNIATCLGSNYEAWEMFFHNPGVIDPYRYLAEYWSRSDADFDAGDLNFDIRRDEIEKAMSLAFGVKADIASMTEKLRGLGLSANRSPELLAIDIAIDASTRAAINGVIDQQAIEEIKTVLNAYGNNVEKLPNSSYDKYFINMAIYLGRVYLVMPDSDLTPEVYNAFADAIENIKDIDKPFLKKDITSSFEDQFEGMEDPTQINQIRIENMCRFVSGRHVGQAIGRTLATTFED